MLVRAVQVEMPGVLVALRLFVLEAVALVDILALVGKGVVRAPTEVQVLAVAAVAGRLLLIAEEPHLAVTAAAWGYLGKVLTAQEVRQAISQIETATPVLAGPLLLTVGVVTLVPVAVAVLFVLSGLAVLVAHHLSQVQT